MASHFRYGNLSWQKAGPAVTFQNEQSWRASAFGTPAVGAVIANGEGCISFGDGTSVCPQYKVTFVNAAEDYLIMHALAPGSTTDRNVPHTYTTAGPFTATTSSCCTISTLNNANDASWQVSSLVDLADDESPKSTVPPIVQLPEGGVQTFTIPAVDNGGETKRFRLTTALESCLGCLAPHPPGLSIDPTSGQVSWNTTGRNTGLGLWWTGVVVEALANGTVVSSTQIDYIIRVGGTTANLAPTWDDSVTPADGTVFTVQSGQQVAFNLKAIDPDAGDTVQIRQNSGPGTLTPTDGNPATAAFTYTAQPSDVGNDVIVQFLAQDNGSPPTGPPFRSFIIRVTAPVKQYALTLSPSTATNDTGTSHTVTGHLTESGTDQPAVKILFSVTGANTASGNDTTGATGRATFAYTGTTVGSDAIAACADINGNATCDSGEPTATAAATWVTPAPKCDGKSPTAVTTGTSGGKPAIFGTPGDDVIIGTSAGEVIFGYGGNDVICAGDGNDDVRAADGDDTVFGEGGMDKVTGAAGSDRILGGDGNDGLLSGGAGNDTIDGNDGDDHIHGDGGNDTLRGGAGADDISGYAGNDTIDGGTEADYCSGDGGTNTVANCESGTVPHQ